MNKTRNEMDTESTKSRGMFNIKTKSKQIVPILKISKTWCSQGVNCQIITGSHKQLVKFLSIRKSCYINMCSLDSIRCKSRSWIYSAVYCRLGSRNCLILLWPISTSQAHSSPMRIKIDKWVSQSMGIVWSGGSIFISTPTMDLSDFTIWGK